jgi:hypothetical protein
VGLGLVLVGRLIQLVSKSILGRGKAGGELAMCQDLKSTRQRTGVYCVGQITPYLPAAQTDIGVLGDLLVDLLAGSGSVALDGLADVLHGLSGGLHCDSLRRQMTVWICVRC